ncbi:hypothetical protein AVEN_40408-1 [Araneus ventricosus]|uniref:Uncharacterized protein n=1 Tax=Araneus ventricosus TaxID=182803 RepID=A0A4Y2DBS6_ARAVE|nr:hypothetical protein AVEN_40408-1 [Araneus ventricosus]
MYLSDGSCNSSSAEAGVLIVITDRGPISPEGGTHYHRQWASHYCTLRGRETPLSNTAAIHPSTRGGPQGNNIDVETSHYM